MGLYTGASMEIKFRDHTEADLAFIYSSWIKSFREINIKKIREGDEVKEYKTGCALWDIDVYFKRQRQIIDRVIPVSFVSIACSPEDAGQIIGFIVYRDYSPEIRIVSYVYVKHNFRKLGIARRLYEQLGPCRVATHGGVSTRKLIQKAELVYDPFFDYEGA